MKFDLTPVFDEFPDLSPKQKEQFQQFAEKLAEWNEKINLISRTDVENLPRRHILHSLAIAKVMAFEPDSRILDVGTGGGFPGIPLAILFPDCKFHLVDAIGKKIMVVQDLIEQLGLENATAAHERADKVKGQFDFVVARAVTQLPKFMNWIRKKVKRTAINPLPNGVLYLKGGDLTEEFEGIKEEPEAHPIEFLFSVADSMWDDKYVIHVPVDRETPNKSSKQESVWGPR